MSQITPPKHQGSLQSPSNETISHWFDKLISDVSVDRLMMETKTAPSVTEKFYLNAINEDHDATNNFLREQSTKYFVSQLLQDYFKELKSFNSFPQKLAFDLSDAKILVWAQIKDNDELTEDALILSEARANSKYNDHGFYISSTIIEESDHLPIPSHYHVLQLNGQLSSSYRTS